jgi:hypothetical protein
MADQISHESLKPLIYALPPRMRERYFAWRKQTMAAHRSRGSGAYDFFAPEFVAECLLKLIEMTKQVENHVAMFSGDPPTPNLEPPKESDQ